MMNNLTDGMIRLSGEISALRHNRSALTCDLVLGRADLGKTVSGMIAGFQRDRQDMGEKIKTELGEGRAELESRVSGMIAGFQHDRQEMGEKTRAELDEARSNLENTMLEMTAGFKRDREKMAEKTKDELGEYVNNMKDAVAGMRQNVAGLRGEFANDIRAARTSWSGFANERVD